MTLSPALLKKISIKYEPSSMVDMVYKGNDISFKTDENGNAIQLFIGKRKENGNIKGDRYTRTLRYDDSGKIIKDHWDRKGTSS